MLLHQKTAARAWPIWMLAASLWLGAAGTASAVPMGYGDFSAATVTFRNVTEDSTTDPLPPALYGAPSVAGNSLDFSNVSFGASATGAAGIDLTQGSLTMGIEASCGAFITRIVLREAGDYSLIGSGGAGTLAAVAAAAYLDVLEVDGVPITPINLNANLVFAPSNGDFDLANDGSALARIWNGELVIDVTALLRSQAITGRATKVALTLNNMLAATSEAGTAAFIGKQDVDVDVQTVPEPGTLLLLGTGLSGLFALGHRSGRSH